jgi:uncharacterized protein YprB with RNaseH-like and TPR domain
MLHKIKGSKLISNEKGSFLYVPRALTEIDAPELVGAVEKNKKAVTGKNLRARVPELSYLSRENMLFFDIESYGLGSVDNVFMIAMAHFNHEVDLSVLFARDFSEEGAMLKHFIDTLRKYKDKENSAFFTYNGTSFDIPRLDRGARRSGLVVDGFRTIGEYLGGEHYDLYSWIRARKSEFGLPDAKLQTLEKLLFGYVRKEDIAGRRIPETYHKYIFGKTLDGKSVSDEEATGELEKVINHNFIDTLSMVALLSYLCAERK